MALFEYYCDACRSKFERISSFEESEVPAVCTRCQSSDKTRKLISRFAVGGQGDLRESTMHGCHDCHVSGPNSEHKGHDHASGED